ncbi:septum formation inhibitor Maf [uncultured Croceitalea sp.]|uniref:septum formation inhibitor Maf n=1 Tax=uncultured Croceitalea sp. TaxID=1798908 RepID=UPI0033062DBE
MKKWIRFELVIVLFAIAVITFEGCKEKSDSSSQELALNSGEVKSVTVKEPKKTLSEDFKKYWYAGNAEITSYKLEQARYGEVREGTSVLVYVTEPFLPDVQVKADRSNTSNVPVLKLNATKKYLTGIYPYSIMSSTFYPVHDNQHAIKTSLSVQEWCGHVYSQLNNREQFEFTSHSYFEGEADQNLKLEKAILENEIWNKIRINPSDLPIGEISIIPSLEFFRTKHQEMKALNAAASLTTTNGISSYTIDYGEAIRKLTINFTSDFPYTIESWKEEFKSGYGTNAKHLTSSGTKMKSIKTPYWRQNSNKYIGLRDSLGL